jgi:hypothetical protein
MSSVS